MSEQALSEGTVFDDAYTIQKIIGEGGFGVVYHATRNSDGRDVALKVMRNIAAGNEKLYEEQKNRFMREVNLIKRLQNPYLVELLGSGIVNKEPYMALEYIQGEELADVIKRGPLEPDLTKTIICQVLEALAEAHKKGVVHRDLKPANIMLIGEGDDIQAKVLDFGIAGIQSEFKQDGDGDITKAGQVRGSPHYMAPEQFVLFSTPRLETDIYAMGLILIECCTGKKAVQAPSGEVADVIRMQVQQPVQIPPEVQGGPFERLLQLACHKEADFRYRSAEEMLEALKNIDLHDVQQRLTAVIDPELVNSVVADAVAKAQATKDTGTAETLMIDASAPAPTAQEGGNNTLLFVVGGIVVVVAVVILLMM